MHPTRHRTDNKALFFKSLNNTTSNIVHRGKHIMSGQFFSDYILRNYMFRFHARPIC